MLGIKKVKHQYAINANYVSKHIKYSANTYIVL